MTRPLPEEMPDTWSARAYPFLWAAVARCETYGGANSEELAADTGLPAGELDATARRLRDDGFLEISF
jgi:hypothetical protein